jgi:cytochrome b6-f complex iron-sulfur subunit
VSSPRRLRAAVEAMLRDRRPRRFDADPEDAAQLHAAAALRAGHPGADLPSAAFIDRLGDRLRAAATTGAPDPARARPARRTFLRGAGLAAAAVAAGVGTDRAVIALRGEGDTTARPAGPAVASSDLVPDTGGWVGVARLADVRTASAMRFRAGSVEGVLVPKPDGTIVALSAVCTHLGCLLTVNTPASSLDCPCHGATFAFDGTPSNPTYKRPLTPLPRLQTRIQGTEVQVFLA